MKKLKGELVCHNYEGICRRALEKIEVRFQIDMHEEVGLEGGREEN